MNYDAWLAREPEVYEEPPSPVDPRDDAYTEACEEIDRLKRIIERLQHEAKSNVKDQNRGV